MKENAVVIFAYKRPKYAQIVTECISRCDSVEEFDVILSVDGPSWMFERHQIYSSVMAGLHVGNVWNMARTFKECLKRKYRRVVAFEEDFLVRKDALEYVLGLNDEPRIRSLMKGTLGQYFPLGNVYSDKVLRLLVPWLYSRTWIGKPRPCFRKDLLGVGHSGHDGVFCQFSMEYGASCFSRTSYAGHIGITGENSGWDRTVEDMIFSSIDSCTPEAEQWMLNAAKLFSNGASSAFCPKDFVFV